MHLGLTEEWLDNVFSVITTIMTVSLDMYSKLPAFFPRLEISIDSAFAVLLKPSFAIKGNPCRSLLIDEIQNLLRQVCLSHPSVCG